jgi:PIN domain nuclease of toxin-antitoxin system
LDWAHRDPADRLICATALEHKIPLVTHDLEITRWGGVQVVW